MSNGINTRQSVRWLSPASPLVWKVGRVRPETACFQAAVGTGQVTSSGESGRKSSGLLRLRGRHTQPFERVKHGFIFRGTPDRATWNRESDGVRTFLWFLETSFK